LKASHSVICTLLVKPIQGKAKNQLLISASQAGCVAADKTERILGNTLALILVCTTSISYLWVAQDARKEKVPNQR